MSAVAQLGRRLQQAREIRDMPLDALSRDDHAAAQAAFGTVYEQIPGVKLDDQLAGMIGGKAVASAGTRASSSSSWAPSCPT